MSHKKYNVSLHIFRRDLRLDDNTALIAALAESTYVIPCFILDPRQLRDNEYRSDNVVEFMLQCLEALDDALRQKQGRLYLFFGEPALLLEKLLNSQNIQAVYFNADYTPYSQRRDAALHQMCAKHKVACNVFDDALLNPPGTILKDNGKPYTVFTPFLKKSMSVPVRKPLANLSRNYHTAQLEHETGKEIFTTILPVSNPKLLLKGGQDHARQLLEQSRLLKDYAQDRNIPSKKGTTFLSAHNKFGTLSIRTIYWYFMEHLASPQTLVSELYWRDFFTHILFYYPSVLGHAFNKKYDAIVWKNDPSLFKAWCEGKTGFPIVDAGMRQLRQTGWMHNRVRMIVASFLVKDLHIDWRWGEKYFAQTLIDYDVAVNNGNWQWAASTGCDAQPYFRIFNPWRQQEKFDPDCAYIKQWIPELRGLTAKQIHALAVAFPSGLAYPQPLVDHGEASAIAKAMYANVSR